MDRGHDVEIYSLEGPSNESKVHPSVESYELLKRTRYIPDIPKNYVWRTLKALKLLVAIGYKSPLICLRTLNAFKYGKHALSLRFLYAVMPLIAKPAYDIVHCQFGIYALQSKRREDAGALRLREFGVLQGKLVTSFRGFDISWYVKARGRTIYDCLFRKGDFFLTNCNFFKNRAIDLGCDPQKIRVLGSGIDCSRFAFKPRYFPVDGRIQIATTARLTEKKGIEYSIRAVAKLLNTYPNLEYNIVGDGALRDDLQRLIDELGASHSIRLLGWMQQREVVQVLEHSHLFVAPSVTAADGNQDAPVNTLKEAMAMGLPVVATRHGGIPELVQEGTSGLLVPERDAEAIAQALASLIDHPDRWVDMGKAGRAYVEAHYDMRRLNDELVEIYQQLLDIPEDAAPHVKPNQRLYTKSISSV